MLPTQTEAAFGEVDLGYLARSNFSVKNASRAAGLTWRRWSIRMVRLPR